MVALLPSLVLVLAMALSYNLNGWSHGRFKASEQLRLDAFTWSLCHQRRSFIIEKVVPENEEIRDIQVEIESILSACLASSAIFETDACEPVEPALQALSLKGKAAEAFQDFARAEFVKARPQIAENLRRENALKDQLSVRFGFSEWFMDGFRREMHTPPLALELERRGILWPRRLEPQPLSFEDSQQTESRYRPIRTLIGVNSKLQWEGLKTSKIQTFDGTAQSTSHCFVSINFEAKL